MCEDLRYYFARVIYLLETICVLLVDTEIISTYTFKLNQRYPHFYDKKSIEPLVEHIQSIDCFSIVKTNSRFTRFY